MHANNIIHRDIKPMNIFVKDKLNFKVKQIDLIEVQIGDFSESRHLNFGKLVKVGKRTIGSPFTMAPEIIKKEYYDFRVIKSLLKLIVRCLGYGSHIIFPYFF